MQYMMRHSGSIEYVSPKYSPEYFQSSSFKKTRIKNKNEVLSEAL